MSPSAVLLSVIPGRPLLGASSKFDRRTLIELLDHGASHVPPEVDDVVSPWPPSVIDRHTVLVGDLITQRHMSVGCLFLSDHSTPCVGDSVRETMLFNRSMR